MVLSRAPDNEALMRRSLEACKLRIGRCYFAGTLPTAWQNITTMSEISLRDNFFRGMLDPSLLNPPEASHQSCS